MTDRTLKPATDVTGTFRSPVRALKEPQQGGSAPSTGGQSLPVTELDGPALEALAEKLNLASQAIGRDLRFKVDIHNRSSVIQVLDRETGEVIREIPPEHARVAATGEGELELRLLDSRA